MPSVRGKDWNQNTLLPGIRFVYQSPDMLAIGGNQPEVIMTAKSRKRFVVGLSEQRSTGPLRLLSCKHEIATRRMPINHALVLVWWQFWFVLSQGPAITLIRRNSKNSIVALSIPLDIGYAIGCYVPA